MVSCNQANAQHQLDGLSKFCSPNQMIANETKTKYMVFGKTNDFSLVLNGKPIDRVTSYKCLGNIINSTCQPNGNIFRENAEYLSNKARQSAVINLNKLKNAGNIPPKCMLHLYQTMIQPVLLYGSDIWGTQSTCASTPLDKVLYWWLRMILRVKLSTSKQMLLGEAGVLPPSILCHQNALLYFVRLNNLPEGSVLKNAFLESKKLSDLGFKSWYTRVWELVEYYNINVTELTNCEKSKQDIKYDIKNKFIRDWMGKLNDSDHHPILRTYKFYKDEFKCEDYLDLVQNPKYRTALSKFRTSSHTLAIERGRHTNPVTPLEKRTCRTCNELEDEIRFLVDCQMFLDERHVLFTKIREKIPNFLNFNTLCKFTFLLKSTDPQICTWTSKFIYNSFKKRNSSIQWLTSIKTKRYARHH